MHLLCLLWKAMHRSMESDAWIIYAKISTIGGIYLFPIPSFSLRAASPWIWGKSELKFVSWGCIILITVCIRTGDQDQYVYMPCVYVYNMRKNTRTYVKKKGGLFRRVKIRSRSIILYFPPKFTGAVTVKARSRYCWCSIFLSWAIILRDGTIGHATCQEETRSLKDLPRIFQDLRHIHMLRLDLKFPPRWFSERIFSNFHDG